MSHTRQPEESRSIERLAWGGPSPSPSLSATWRYAKGARRVGSSVTDLLAEAVFNHVRHQAADAATKCKDLLDEPRADVRVLLRRHHEDRFNITIQLAVHQRQ